VQVDAQLVHGAEDELLRVVDVGVQAFCNLFQSPSFDVFQQESLPLVHRQTLQCCRQVLNQSLFGVLALERDGRRGYHRIQVELIAELRLAPAHQIECRVEGDSMDPCVELGFPAKLASLSPGFQQRFLHGIRRQLGIARDTQARVVPTPTALTEHSVEVVWLSLGFEEGEHRTWTDWLEKGYGRLRELTQRAFGDLWIQGALER